MMTFSLKRTDQTFFFASFTLPRQIRICNIFHFFWCSWITTFSNIKTYLSLALKQKRLSFKRSFEKRNIIVTFQSGQLTEQPKTLEDLDHFDLKFYLNCPIRIKIITGSHIFILFLPRVGTLCLHFNPCFHLG